MSFNLSISFKSFEELDNFVSDINKFKLWKNKQEKKKEKQKYPENEINEQFNFTDDKRGIHQKHYHNPAKMNQSEHPELSYREALKFVYKNNNKINITI